MPRTRSLLRSESTESYTREETDPVCTLRWTLLVVASGDPWCVCGVKASRGHKKVLIKMTVITAVIKHMV